MVVPVRTVLAGDFVDIHCVVVRETGFAHALSAFEDCDCGIGWGGEAGHG